jgi:hypothetical protein
MNKEKHQDVTYVRGKAEASRKVKCNRFKSMTDFGDGLYELHMEKQSVELNLPIYLGVQILQLAKLALLRFYYDFLRRCCHFDKFQVAFCDTDSIYIAHSAVNKDGDVDWQAIIKEEFRDEYMRQIKNNHHVLNVDPNHCFFPRICCDAHAARDRRTPGLLKVEFDKGVCYAGLASKTYWVATPTSQKYSSKVLQKDKLEQNTGERYMQVLTSQKPDGATNVGFRTRQGNVFTYSQHRKALPYFYIKREVLSDGVTTRPLKITLNSWK